MKTQASYRSRKGRETSNLELCQQKPFAPVAQSQSSLRSQLPQLSRACPSTPTESNDFQLYQESGELAQVLSETDEQRHVLAF